MHPPPLAIDRLAGLSHTSKNLIGTLGKGKIPAKIDSETLMLAIPRITAIITRLLDCQIFPWLSDKSYGTPSAQALNRSASIVADHITGSLADPVIRNSQEQRQLSAISMYLDRKGYTFIHSRDIVSPESMPPKSYSFHLNCPVKLSDKEINMPVDVVVQTSHTAQASSMPLLVECKSAGDFTNTNKRRKEEAIKAMQLRQTYGDNINYILFLCGYFDSTYLGYEASEQIDWVWEHRISDFDFFGI